MARRKRFTTVIDHSFKIGDNVLVVEATENPEVSRIVVKSFAYGHDRMIIKDIIEGPKLELEKIVDKEYGVLIRIPA